LRREQPRSTDAGSAMPLTGRFTA